MRGSQKKIINSLIILIMVSSFVVNIQNSSSDTPVVNFTLRVITNDNGNGADYLVFISQNLARLGINLEISVLPWPAFVTEMLTTKNYDLVYTSFTSSNDEPDFSWWYGQEGPMNIFGYNASMDWDEDKGTGTNEWYLQQMDDFYPPTSEERLQHAYDWQDYLMNELFAIYPTFTYDEYATIWKQLGGYNYSKGLVQSWGGTWWVDNETHTGKKTTNDIISLDYLDCTKFNPLYLYDCGGFRRDIFDSVLDPLVWKEHDKSYWPHIVNYEHKNATHVTLNIREGIKWGNDIHGVNVNGSEEVTSKDVFFTLYCYKNLSSYTSDYDWLKDFTILDNYTLDIFIDKDPGTAENDYDSTYLSTLAETYLLPEFYLNQTQLIDEVTPNSTHISWSAYDDECFGSGLFSITNIDLMTGVNMTERSKSWWKDNSITNDTSLNWNKRFGSFSREHHPTKRFILNAFTITDIDAEFQAGKFDVRENLPNGTMVEYYDANSNFLIRYKPSKTFEFLGFNMDPSREFVGNPYPCPSDPGSTVGVTIREAITKAVNIEDITNFFHEETRDRYYHPIAPYMWIWKSPDLEMYKYDLVSAKELMIKGGFEIDNYSPSLNGYSLIAIIPLLAISVTSLIYKRRKNN